MKKLLMALAMTMSLAAGTAYAGCGCDVPKTSSDCGCPEPTCEKQCEKPSCDECGEMSKCFSKCRDQKREEIYCRLNLDDCQRDKAREIEERYDSDLDCIVDKIKDDHKCLCEKINASCLDKNAVKEQEKLVKQGIKDYKAKIKCMDKDFKAILKCEQKSDYRKIRSEIKYRARHSMKFCCKCCTK